MPVFSKLKYLSTDNPVTPGKSLGAGDPAKSMYSNLLPSSKQTGLSIMFGISGRSFIVILETCAPSLNLLPRSVPPAASYVFGPQPESWSTRDRPNVDSKALHMVDYWHLRVWRCCRRCRDCGTVPGPAG